MGQGDKSENMKNGIKYEKRPQRKDGIQKYQRERMEIKGKYHKGQNRKKNHKRIKICLKPCLVLLFGNIYIFWL